MSSRRASDRPSSSNERYRDPKRPARVPGSVWYFAGGMGQPPTVPDLRQWKQRDKLGQERRKKRGGVEHGHWGGAFAGYGKGGGYMGKEQTHGKGGGSYERNRPPGQGSGSDGMTGSGSRGGEHDGSEVAMGRHGGSQRDGNRPSGAYFPSSSGRRRRE